MMTHTRTNPNSSETKRILFVEDDESARLMLLEKTKNSGYSISFAENGLVAKEKFSNEYFDAVVTDIQMPEMDGIELAYFIKKIRPVPVILTSALSNYEARKGRPTIEDGFIAKPFNIEDLAAAIEKCLKLDRRGLVSTGENLCRICIDDFISGRQLQCSIYIRLSGNRFIKLAHQGESISLEKLRTWKSKGLDFLYMHRDDFRKYVDFNMTLSKAIVGNIAIQKEKKIRLVRHTSDLLLEIILHDGLDEKLSQNSLALVESIVDVLSDEPALLDLLTEMNSQECALYAHSVGVSFYSALLAQGLGWTQLGNKFKVALAGLLHDVGEREISDLLMRPRYKWSIEEVKLFESHPSRGVEILRELPFISEDVLRVVQEHHEGSAGHGFPKGLNRTHIHPMSKLIAVADEFCDRVIRRPHHQAISPSEALRKMEEECPDKLTPEFFKALTKLFPHR